MEYILVKISTLQAGKITDSDSEGPDFPPDISHKDLKWYPAVRDAKPVFDAATEVIETAKVIVEPDYIFG